VGRTGQVLLQASVRASEKGYEWDQRDYTARLLTEVELPWQTNTSAFPVEPEADPIATSHTMIKKYGGSPYRDL
jgi:hypothetical protein